MSSGKLQSERESCVVKLCSIIQHHDRVECSWWSKQYRFKCIRTDLVVRSERKEDKCHPLEDIENLTENPRRSEGTHFTQSESQQWIEIVSSLSQFAFLSLASRRSAASSSRDFRYEIVRLVSSRVTIGGVFRLRSFVIASMIAAMAAMSRVSVQVSVKMTWKLWFSLSTPFFLLFRIFPVVLSARLAIASNCN